MRRVIASIAIVLGLSACVKATPAGTASVAGSAHDRGRYLTLIGGCNDCHTAGFSARAGNVPEKDWLKGDATGWQGPWGTTYAANLRDYFQRTSETQWLASARSAQMRPPMPWYALRAMSQQDLRDIYQFVHSLGASGTPVPAYLPPGSDAPAPKMQLVLPSGPAPGT